MPPTALDAVSPGQDEVATARREREQDRHLIQQRGMLSIACSVIVTTRRAPDAGGAARASDRIGGVQDRQHEQRVGHHDD